MIQEIIYLNGEYVDKKDAKISIFDRSVLMADSVYEVSAVLNGKLIDNESHLLRLKRSLNELNIPSPLSESEIIEVQKALIRKNNLVNGKIYLQISRGEGERDFVIDPNMKPTIFLFSFPVNLLEDQQKPPLKVLTQPDIRWKRRDIKTTQLLAQSLAKTHAKKEGFDDVWFVNEEGYITEGSSNNAWIVQGDTLRTRKASHQILNGITRQTFIKIISDAGLSLDETPFTVKEAEEADEAFSTSAGMWARPVSHINGHPIADGKAGPITLKLREAYIAFAQSFNQQ